MIQSDGFYSALKMKLQEVIYSTWNFLYDLVSVKDTYRE